MLRNLSWLVVLGSLVLIEACVSAKPTNSVEQLTPTEPTATFAVDTLPSRKTVNNIDVQLMGYEREGAYLIAKVCYEKPTDQVWTLDQIALIVENQAIGFSSYQGARSSDRPDGFLCLDISFPVGVSPRLGRVELIVGQLETQTETYDCDKAQKKLDEAHTGIEVKCDLGAGTETSTGYTVIKAPKDIRGDKVSELVQDAFVDVIEGPWQFAFVVDRPSQGGSHGLSMARVGLD